MILQKECCFTDLSPKARGAYLEWLASGRNDPDAEIGLVFLYFYGLERRLLVDSGSAEVPDQERAQIREEVRRLLSIYGDNGSFNGYANTFLDFTIPSGSDHRLYQGSPQLEQRTWGLPVEVRTAVAQASMDGVPIPVAWAFCWAWYDPETSIRIPARRCREEFEALFRLRYEKRFKSGLVVKPNKRRLKMEYRPASPSIYDEQVRTFDDLPDVTSLKAPIRKLRDLFDECANDLDAYSRWVGRHPGEEHRLQAKALLPGELMAVDSLGEPGREILSVLEEVEDVGIRSVVETKKVLEHWPPGVGEKYRKADAVGLSQFLEKLGYGIEPDVRFHGPRLDTVENAVVFRLGKDAPSAPSQQYMISALTLRLAAAIAVADGVVTEEEQHSLEKQIASSESLMQGDRDRLKAHVDWLLVEQPNLVGIKKKVEDLPMSSRQSLGRILIAMAAADGSIDPEEIKTLKKLFRQLGLDPESLYSEIHAFQTGSRTEVSGPVTVRSRDQVKGHTIDSEPAAPPLDDTKAVVLNPVLVEAKRTEAEQAAALLTTIFNEEEPEVPNHAPVKVGIVSDGLDEQHSKFLRQLSDKSEWDREEVATMAEDLGLFVDGALETINEAVLEKVDEPLFDIADTIILDHDILKEFQA